MLEQITPLLLTYNEAANIGRTLKQLSWARDIVIVDSFSNDETLAMVSGFPQVRLFQRAFDNLEAQWTFGLKKTGIRSEWILAMDADYFLTPKLLKEIETLDPAADVSGYRVRFVYCVYGHPLRGSAYPPVTVLYRGRNASYAQDGHAHRVVIDGKTVDLNTPMLHDDRKPLAHWMQSQLKYQRLEAEKLLSQSPSHLNWPDRVRKARVLAPLATLFYCLFVKGLIFDGQIGLFYAFQRVFAELLLSLILLEHDLGGSDD